MLRKTRLLGILVFISFLFGCGGGGTTKALVVLVLILRPMQATGPGR